MALLPSQNGPRIRYSGLLALILLRSLIPDMAVADTWVFTDTHHPVNSHANARLVVLDDTKRLQDKLSEGLPADPRQAMVIVKQRMQSQDGMRLQKDLATAQQGVADAWALGITKVPAVVVDRQYVVYGEPDVAKAEQQIAQSRGRQP